MNFWTLIFTTLIGGLIIYLWRITTYFKRHGLIHKTPWPILGNSAPVMFGKIHFFEHVAKYYTFWPEAKYVGFLAFMKPAILIRDLEIIKTITVKHFDNFPDHDVLFQEKSDPLLGKSLFSLRGDTWREARSIVSPVFTSGKIKQMFELMEVCGKDFADFCYSNSGDINVKDMFSKYTNDVIATCAFGISVNSLKHPDNQFYTLGKRALNLNFWQNIKFLISLMFPKVAEVFNLPVLDAELTDFFTNLVKETVHTRKEKGIYRPDLIQLLIEAEEKSKGTYQLDIINMTAQAFVFFVAGFDTSSSLMAFAAIQMAKHQDLQTQLIEEVDRVMSESNGHPSYETINSLPYLEAFLYETLRFFPIVGFMNRLCVKDFELPPALPGLKPFTIPAGMPVWISSHGIHNDPQYYEQPNKFDPNRFLNQKMTLNIPSYLSFGIGPRACIGNRFALLESKLVLFYFLTKCKFEPSHKLKEPIKYVTSTLAIMIEGGFWVKIVPRDKNI